MAWPLETDQTKEDYVEQLRLPTFIDFVDYILKHRNVPQWIPIADLCPVCTGAFDYIFRLETGIHDAQLPFADGKFLNGNKLQIFWPF